MDTTQLQQLLVRLEANETRGREITSRLDNVDFRLVAVEITGKETKDILEYMKSGVRFLGGLGSVVRWCASIAAACIGLYYTIKKG